MRVKSDTSVKGLAQSIDAELESADSVCLQACGHHAINQMVKGIAASQAIVPGGVYAIPDFTHFQGNRGDEISGIQMIVRRNRRMDDANQATTRDRTTPQD